MTAVLCETATEENTVVITETTELPVATHSADVPTIIMGTENVIIEQVPESVSTVTTST